MKRSILLAAAIFLLAGCSGSNGTSTPSFNDVLTSRRSVRSYDATKTISEAEVSTLLTAVQDLVGGNKPRIAGAPVLIVSTFERGKSGFFRGEQTNEVGDGWGAYDNGLSNAYLVLTARAMGFDTLIMGMRDAAGLRELFRIPGEETVMAVIALGYRAAEPNQPAHRDFDEIVKFY